MKYWWVNQNQTYRHEVRGGYLWSPKTKSNGARNHFYDTMTMVSPGDLVFSFADTYIKAVGIVTGSHQSASKPAEFGTAGANWTNEGWYVPVGFEELTNPIRPKDNIDLLRGALPARYSPLQDNGDGNQGVYLASVPPNLASVLNSLLTGQVEAIVARSSGTADAADAQELSAIVGNPSISITQRAQLVQARIGQGLFRSRVTEQEPRCRVTGLDDPKFLVASHIKPWAKSSDIEKLDGSNGLLLAPHVDHLFDKGYITFLDDGSLCLSPQLPPQLLSAWGINSPAVSTPFTGQRATYLAFHRANVFRS